MNSFQYSCALQALLFVGKEPFPTIYVDSQKEDEVRFFFEFLLLKPVHSNLTNKKKRDANPPCLHVRDEAE